MIKKKDKRVFQWFTKLSPLPVGNSGTFFLIGELENLFVSSTVLKTTCMKNIAYKINVATG